MKTAPELGLTENEHAALRKVRELLASGEIEHHSVDPDGGMGNFFNMSSACIVLGHSPECGTVMCIGGWVKAIVDEVVDPLDVKKPMSITPGMKYELSEYVCSTHTTGLFYLFHPVIPDWNAITPAMAVEAIDNFLETGRPGWDSIGARHDLFFRPELYDEDSV